MGAHRLEVLFRRYVESRDEGAARELVARTRPRLLAIARRIGNPADAEDSVQTAYLSLLHKGASFDAPVLAWLVTATVRIAYRAKARRQRLKEISEQLVHPPAPQTPAALAADADEFRVLRERVADLPAPLRDPAVLHYFHGLSTEAVSVLLDLGRDAVKKRLQRARIALRSRWGPRYAPLLFALPWWGADAAAAMAGGLAMKKTVGVVILVALSLTATGLVLQVRTDRRTRQEQHTTGRRDVPVPGPAARPGPPPAEQEAVEYSGTVVYPDGRPAAGAEVRIGAYVWKTGQRMPMLYPQLLARTTAGRDGRFLLEPQYKQRIKGIEYHARAEGYAWSAARCSVDGKARIVLVPGGVLEVELRGASAGRVEKPEIHVDRRAEPGTPMVGFSSRGFEGFLLAVAAHGRFDLPAGEYEVYARAEGRVPSRRVRVTVEAGLAVARVIELADGVEYDVEVVDQGGRAVEGATVDVRGPGRSGAQARTDRLGRCRVGGIGIPHVMGVGAYETARFKIDAEGFAPCNRSVRVPDTEGRETIRFVLKRGARVVFRFRGADGKPLVKQSVYVFYAASDPNAMSFGQGYWPTTDQKGEVVFPALLEGTAQVQVRGIEKRLRKVAITGMPQEIGIDLAPGGQELSGRVLLPDGKPLAEGEVAFLPADPETDLDNFDRTPVSNGRFLIGGLRAGAGHLWVWAPGFEAQKLAASVPATALVVRLRERRGIGGVVVRRDGTPVEGVVVRLQRSRSGRWSEVGQATTDGRGRFFFRGVADDPKLHVRVGAGRGHDAGNWIDSYGLGRRFRPGDTNVRVVVKPRSEGWGLRIPIEMRDSDGRPLTGRVQIRYDRNGRRGTWHLGGLEPTEMPGRFVLDYYDDPGVCDFRFTLAGYRPVERKGVAIEDRRDQPLLKLSFDRGAVLEVTARYADGSPVAGETLRCGEAVARTDARGQVTFGGFPSGVRRVEIWKEGDHFLHAGAVEAELPGRIAVTLRRCGCVIARAPNKTRTHWKLVDARGVVRDEQVTNTPWARLHSPVAGPHKLIVEQGETTTAHDVVVTLGKSVSAGDQ